MEPVSAVIGQERAVEAVRFGIDIQHPGYNIFAFGRPGTGKRTLITYFLTKEARARPEPDDWCYVHNFELSHRPRALRLPPGWGTRLRQDSERMLADLAVSLPQVLEGETFSARRERLGAEYDARARTRMERVEQAADASGLSLMQGKDGFSLAPRTEDGEIMTPEAFHALDEAVREDLREKLEATEEELEAAMRDIRRLQGEMREDLVALQRNMAKAEVEERIAPLRESYRAVDDVGRWLDDVAEDVLDNLDRFLPDDDEEESGRELPTPENALHYVREQRHLRRYRINVLVDGSSQAGAPVVLESYPTLRNLVGRIEQEQLFGALSTDFTLIKPGALHRANGGYLLLEMDELAQHSVSWDALKRALLDGEARIEPPGDPRNTMPMITLDPEPIPLDLKVIVLGETGEYYFLQEHDPAFPELFKVGAEFGSSMERGDDNCDLYARVIGAAAQREGLLPFDRGAVARIVEHSSRLAGDQHRLSTDFLAINTVLVESEYHARQARREKVTAEDVQAALDAQVRRADLARERIFDGFARGVVHTEVTGEAVGEMNALTVVGRGDFDFGLPVRVSARVRLGSGDVVDIERESELGGPLHSKGIMILGGFLAGRYAVDDSLSFQASLTFEQSHGPVDGDSASSTELYALLSALARLPLRQDLAVTGAVSQMGDVQAIGGVNEKIEGFFDLCLQRGLTGSQGVLIPEANREHLMLRADVVQAVREGRFHIYAVAHVDEGLELLTGLPAGERGADGAYPEGSVNRLVEDRLRDFAERKSGGDEDDPEPGADDGE